MKSNLKSAQQMRRLARLQLLRAQRDHALALGQAQHLAQQQQRLHAYADALAGQGAPHTASALASTLEWRAKVLAATLQLDVHRDQQNDIVAATNQVTVQREIQQSRTTQAVKAAVLRGNHTEAFSGTPKRVTK
ncbi:MAG: hypothetical protein U5J78_04420 [Parasphingorhabdus sp.]|nr:hypothetical protein [Parasphingorhabdus sp.]